DDASRLDSMSVTRIVAIPADPDAAVAAIRGALALARRRSVGVSIAGARHTMGGQAIARDGIVLDMLGHDRMDLEEGTTTLHVGSGAAGAR
ncbi:MAG: FAD-binding oxidoreductase, partial [Acidobacteria bacterium]